jgi:hypothetical protein
MSRSPVTAQVTRLAIVVVGLALLVPAPSASAHRSHGLRAQGSRIHLTFAEARREIRYRIKRLARKRGDTDLDYEVGGCRRDSARRVRCRTYEDYRSGRDGDDYICFGRVQVVEYVSRYRTRGKGMRCV